MLLAVGVEEFAQPPVVGPAVVIFHVPYSGRTQLEVAALGSLQVGRNIRTRPPSDSTLAQEALTSLEDGGEWDRRYAC